MPMTVIVYRLSVYFSLCLTVSSLYLPMMKSSSSARRSRNPPVTSDLGSSYRSSGTDGDAYNKRRNVYGVFSNMMSRHAHRHKTDQAFVDRMFNIFDIDDCAIWSGYTQFAYRNFYGNFLLANCVYPDQMPYSVASEVDLHILYMSPSNRVIQKKEFKAVLQILGIVNHNF